MSESSGIADFRQAAAHYCELAEHGGTLPVARLLLSAERALVTLYGAVLSLPRGEAAQDVWTDRIEKEDWTALYRGLKHVLGAYDLYGEIFDPAALGDAAGSIDGGEKMVVSSLADDLADIWRDLRPGLNAWPAASEIRRADIVWEWRESFESHWGQHLVDALRAIHWWRYVHRAGDGA